MLGRGELFLSVPACSSTTIQQNTTHSGIYAPSKLDFMVKNKQTRARTQSWAWKRLDPGEVGPVIIKTKAFCTKLTNN